MSPSPLQASVFGSASRTSRNAQLKSKRLSCTSEILCFFSPPHSDSRKLQSAIQTPRLPGRVPHPPGLRPRARSLPASARPRRGRAPRGCVRLAGPEVPQARRSPPPRAHLLRGAPRLRGQPREWPPTHPGGLSPASGPARTSPSAVKAAATRARGSGLSTSLSRPSPREAALVSPVRARPGSPSLHPLASPPPPHSATARQTGVGTASERRRWGGEKRASPPPGGGRPRHSRRLGRGRRSRGVCRPPRRHIVWPYFDADWAGGAAAARASESWGVGGGQASGRGVGAEGVRAAVRAGAEQRAAATAPRPSL